MLASLWDVDLLPTTGRWTVWPRKRPITGAIDVAGSSIFALHDAFRQHNIRLAWQVYKEMFRKDTLHQMEADDHTTVLGYLTTHTLPLLGALHASRAMENMRRYGHQPDLRDYHAVMLCHLRNNDARRCALMFQRMLEDGVQPDLRAYTLLLAGYAQAKHFTGAQMVWKRMGAKVPGARADMDAWAIMIEACGRCSELEEGVKLYKKVQREVPGRLDRKVHEAMIKAYGAVKQIGPALTIFRQIKDGIAASPVDLETYDAVISGCETAQDLEMASELWEELLLHCEERSTADVPVVPLGVTYTRMLALLARHGERERAVDLFEARSKSYPIDTQTYQEFFWAHVSGKDPIGAVKWYDEMVERGHMPDAAVVQKVNQIRNVK
ncbi:hypothetical protein DFJ77DRAFT_426143 [Powellomyces hirtus]|nr:hypothetical protein DFJ77DRAFT_426143 [Powellomyces hirtus]